MNDTQPLVSIALVTYNAEKTIIETLESIYHQTYPTLELVVSDDASQDKTVAIASEWLSKHANRFVRYDILSAKMNVGIAANCNRTFAATTGTYIKEFDGDDRMCPNCIEEEVKYLQGHSDVDVVFAKIEPFGGKKKQIGDKKALFDDAVFFEKTSQQQLEQLYFGSNTLSSTTAMYTRKCLEKYGPLHDERIPLLDDWPKWINLLKAGARFGYVPEVLVQYRMGGVSTAGKSPKFHRSIRLFYFLYLYPERYKRNPEKAVEEVLRDEECKYYDRYYRMQHPWYAFKEWLQQKK